MPNPAQAEQVSSREMTTKDLLDQISDKLWVEFDDETNQALEWLKDSITDWDLEQVQKHADTVATALLNLRYSTAGKQLDGWDLLMLNKAYDGLKKITDQELNALKSGVASSERSDRMDKVVNFTDKNAEKIVAWWGLFWFVRGLFGKKEVSWSTKTKWFFWNMFGKVKWFGKRMIDGVRWWLKWAWLAFAGVLGITKGYPAIKSALKVKEVVSNPMKAIKNTLIEVKNSLIKLLEWLWVYVPTIVVPEPVINSVDPAPFNTDEEFFALIQEQEVGTLHDDHNATFLLPDGSSESVYIPGSLEDLEQHELKTIQDKLWTNEYHKFLLLCEANDIWTNTAHVAAHDNRSSGNDVPVMKGRATALQHSLMKLRHALLDPDISTDQASAKLTQELKKQKEEMRYIEDDVEPVINERDVEDIFVLIWDYTGTSNTEYQNKKLEIFKAMKKELLPENWALPAGATDMLNQKLSDDLIQDDPSYAALKDLLDIPAKNEKLLSLIKNTSISSLTIYLQAELGLTHKASNTVAKDLTKKYGEIDQIHTKQKHIVKKELKLRFKNFTEADQKELFVQQYNSKYPESPISVDDAPFDAALEKITVDQIELMKGISMITYAKETCLYHIMEHKDANWWLTSPTELMLWDILWVWFWDVADSTFRGMIALSTQLALTLIPFGAGMAAARLAIWSARMLWVSSLLAHMWRFAGVASTMGRLALWGWAFHLGSTIATNALQQKEFENLLDWRDNKQAILLNMSTYGIFGMLWPWMQAGGIATSVSKISPNTIIPLKVLNNAPIVLESLAFTAASAGANSRWNPEVTFTEALSWKQFLAGLVLAKVRHTKRLDKQGKLNSHVMPEVILKPVNGVVKLVTRTNTKFAAVAKSLWSKVSPNFASSIKKWIGKVQWMSPAQLSAKAKQWMPALQSRLQTKITNSIWSAKIANSINSWMVQPSKMTALLKKYWLKAKDATFWDLFKLIDNKERGKLIFGNLFVTKPSIHIPVIWWVINTGRFALNNIPLISVILWMTTWDNGDRGIREWLENWLLYGVLWRTRFGKAVMYALDSSDIIV